MILYIIYIYIHIQSVVVSVLKSFIGVKTHSFQLAAMETSRVRSQRVLSDDDFLSSENGRKQMLGVATVIGVAKKMGISWAFM